VAEVTHAGEDHRQTGFVGGLDDLIVAHRAARLDHHGRASFDSGQQAVGEGEEGVRGDRAALGVDIGKAVGFGGFLGLGGGDAAESRRFIWPAPIPAVMPSLA
jgi:hypothetical protein